MTENELHERGGPAFPATIPASGGGTIAWHGMTLLDWFAGQALVGMLAGRSLQPGEAFVERAYQIAGEMLVERKFNG